MSCVRSLAGELLADGVWCRALQISAEAPAADPIELSIGRLNDGRQVAPDTLFNVICATKPIVAVALTRLIDEGVYSFGTKVGEALPPHHPLAATEATIAEVLAHTAQLAYPTMLQVNLCADRARDELLRTGVARRAVGYSEVSSQAVASGLIEAATGGAAANFIRQSILDPLDLTNEIRMAIERQELPSLSKRIGHYVRGLPQRATPTLHDASPHVACADRVLLGGYASARGLRRFYSALGRAYAGESVNGLPSATTLNAQLRHRGEPAWHEELGRTCSFGGGFMIELENHGYGPGFSDEAFGHSGLQGASFACHDPATGVSIGVVLNGLANTPLDTDFVRKRVLRACLQDLGVQS